MKGGFKYSWMAAAVLALGLAACDGAGFKSADGLKTETLQALDAKNYSIAAERAVQLTDAIALLIEWGEPVHVVIHEGTRHDLGNPGGYLKAAVDFALDRDDYGPELRAWLTERLTER